MKIPKRRATGRIFLLLDPISRPNDETSDILVLRTNAEIYNSSIRLLPEGKEPIFLHWQDNEEENAGSQYQTHDGEWIFTAYRNGSGILLDGYTNFLANAPHKVVVELVD
ncbi:MAG: hypothetical protein JST06_07165 [Bacteroidetes bacterium]|nr:hypothetical protein [Bacteroidota bacterium]